MPDRFSYEFVIIRVVPKVEREEFMNVGVIVFSKPKRYLDMKYHLDIPRLQALSGEIDIELLKEHLEAWEAICAGAPQGGTIGEQDQPYRFRWLAAEGDSPGLHVSGHCIALSSDYFLLLTFAENCTR